MGAVANLAPELFAGVVAQVPFVDPLTSILDPTLPLTVTEWEEWGNPEADPEVYAYIVGYAPYENVAAVDYPPILAETSLNDTRVLYVEPAKWIARLRATAIGRATSCSRPRWQQVTGASPGGTRPGPTGRSALPGCSTGWVWPTADGRELDRELAGKWTGIGPSPCASDGPFWPPGARVGSGHDRNDDQNPVPVRLDFDALAPGFSKALSHLDNAARGNWTGWSSTRSSGSWCGSAPLS